MTIVVRSVFEDEGKSYPQVYLDECLYELKMLEYDRIDVPKTSVNRKRTSKKKKKKKKRKKKEKENREAKKHTHKIFFL